MDEEEIKAAISTLSKRETSLYDELNQVKVNLNKLRSSLKASQFLGKCYKSNDTYTAGFHKVIAIDGDTCETIQVTNDGFYKGINYRYIDREYFDNMEEVSLEEFNAEYKKFKEYFDKLVNE